MPTCHFNLPPSIASQPDSPGRSDFTGLPEHNTLSFSEANRLSGVGARQGEGPMRFGQFLSACSLGLAAVLGVAGQALAQSHPEFIPLGRVSAAMYRPDSGPAPHIAFLVAHRTANNLNNNACTELSKRGFMVLCFNTRFINNEA